jgi:hypothetical protein
MAKIVIPKGLWINGYINRSFPINSLSQIESPDHPAGVFYLASISILANWVYRIRQLSGQKIWFVMCGLWGFQQIWGVDRFSGGQRREVFGGLKVSSQLGPTRWAKAALQRSDGYRLKLCP